MDTHSPKVLDSASALSRIDGDEELYREVLRVFLDDTPKQLEILEKAVAEGSLETIERQAHSLKSAAANIGAEAMREVASKIELAARARGSEAYEEMVSGLQAEFSRVVASIKDEVGLLN